MNLGDYADDLTTLSIIVGMAVAAMAGFWRLVIVPSMQRALSRQNGEAVEMKELLQTAVKQLTENHHSNERPTMLDRFDDLERKVDRLDGKLDDHMIVAAGDHQSLVDVRERVTRAGF